MKQSDPLTPAEIAVFGQDARRRPDGTVEERGIKWPGSSPEAAASAQPEEWPLQQPVPEPAAPAAPVPAPAPGQRTVDLAAVYPFPDRMQ
jgi:hypothetical protein